MFDKIKNYFSQNTVEKNRQKWIKALRSGKYKQAAETLCDRNDNTFCCLGVAADVFGVDITNPNFNLHKLGGEVYDDGLCVDNLLAYEETLPVAEKLGLTTKQCETLASKNDGGDSFKQIANFIEAGLVEE